MKKNCPIHNPIGTITTKSSPLETVTILPDDSATVTLECSCDIEDWKERFRRQKEEWKDKGYDLLWEDLENFISQELKVQEERLEKERYLQPCGGCPEGHNSYWKSVVESLQWEGWQKEQMRRWGEWRKSGDKNLPYGIWDIDESQECGSISQEHFQDFLKWLNQSQAERIIEWLKKRKVDVLIKNKSWNEEGRRKN